MNSSQGPLFSWWKEGKRSNQDLQSQKVFGNSGIWDDDILRNCIMI